MMIVDVLVAVVVVILISVTLPGALELLWLTSGAILHLCRKLKKKT